MKKEILLNWINALESNKYHPQRGRLHGESGYCPLGVLCDISGLDKWVKVDNDFLYLGQRNYLPKDVLDWAELKGKERGDMPFIIMSLFDQGTSIENIIKHIKKSYKLND